MAIMAPQPPGMAHVGVDVALTSGMDMELKLPHAPDIDPNQMQPRTRSLPALKIMYAFGYSSDDGDVFRRVSPLYVDDIPFIPNGSLPFPPSPCPRSPPQPPLLRIDPNVDEFRLWSKHDQENFCSQPERQPPLLQFGPNIYGWEECKEDQKKYIFRRRHQQKEKSTSSNPPAPPHVIKFKLNPNAPEFIGLQTCKIGFNPDAEEFTPGGVDLGSLSPASSTKSSSSCEESWGSVAISFDESANECENDGSEHDERQEGEIIGYESEDSSFLQNLDENGNWDEGFHSPGPTIESQFNPEAAPFVPVYWPSYSSPEIEQAPNKEIEVESTLSSSIYTTYHQDAFHDPSESIEDPSPSEYNYTQIQEEEEEAGQYQQHCPLKTGLESFIKCIPATPFQNGQIIPFHFVDERETIYFPDLDHSTLSQVIGSSPTQDGIPILLTPEVQMVADCIAKLPESLRVVHPTEDTPYTRVYGLGGFEPKADPNLLTPKPAPSISIESYLLSDENEEDKEMKYVPSYGFIGFGIDSSLSTPSSSHENSQNGRCDPEFVSELEYDLVYGLTGYVPTPAPAYSFVE